MAEKQTRKLARLMKPGEKCVFALKSEKVATLSPEGPKLYETRARKGRHIFYRLADSPVEAKAWAEEHLPRRLGGYRLTRNRWHTQGRLPEAVQTFSSTCSMNR